MTVPAKSADFTETDRIAIYENGVASLAEMNCGFRLRGNSTSNFPKKPLAIKLASKTEVLGMKKHKRWCLLANWIDRSLMRNGVAFDIADKVRAAFSGTDAPGLPWQPHGKSVELVLNGVHVGNYFLCEQIKIDKNRLAIQDGFEDVVKDGGTATTANCGYLLEFDDNYDEYNKFRTSYCNLPCQSKDVITDNTIWNYVKNWVQDIETKLHDGNYTGAYEKLDINSVADYWIVQELTMNNEYRHPKSVYMYKGRNRQALRRTRVGLRLPDLPQHREHQCDQPRLRSQQFEFRYKHAALHAVQLHRGQRWRRALHVVSAAVW